MVTPHWFDDSFKLQRVQPVELYLFPDPLVFNAALSAPPTQEGFRQSDKAAEQLHRVLRGEIKISKVRADMERRDERQAVWSSVTSAAKGTVRVPSSQQDGVWVGRRILLSNELDLATGRRESVNAQIVAGDGVVVDADEDKADYDILITTHSEGAEYVSVSTPSFPGLLRLSAHGCAPLLSEGYSRQETGWNAPLALLCDVDWSSMLACGSSAAFTLSIRTSG